MASIYEVPDLHSEQKLDDEAAVRSALSLVNIIVSRRNPLLGALVMQMQTVFDDSPAALSVSIDRDIHLHINTDYWWRILTNADLADAFIHEALHVAQDHPVRFDPSPAVDAATDLAINQFDDLIGSDYIARAGVTLSNIGDTMRWTGDLRPGESADYYLAKFQQGGASKQDTQTQEQQETDTDVAPASGGSHAVWSQSTNEAEQTITNALSQAMALSGGDGRGVIAAGLVVKIKQGGKAFQLPSLRQGVMDFTRRQTAQAVKRTYSRYAAPRAAGVLRRGRKREVTPQQRIDVFIDASGSISDTALADVFATVARANVQKKTPVQFVPHYFDTEVYDANWGEAIGRGGTRIQAVFDWLRAQNRNPGNDVLIVTDGQGEPTIEDFGYRATWIVTKASEMYTKVPAHHRMVRVNGEKS
jgi:predicted metal-dependent peptidase